MKLLVLGGTKFLGRAVVDAALARGHGVTLFNRGLTSPELFPEAEKLRGDRAGDPAALEGREWDAVIDPSGFVPRIVRASTELLHGSVGHYVFVSSASVYAEPYVPGFEESAPTVELEDPASEEVERDYGALKAACEQVVREVFPDAHTNVRAGLIVGPHDPTGRFTYWPLRMSLGGEALAPGPPERAVQFVDARDLGAWMVEACERGLSGTFNATCEPMSFADLLAACGDAEPVWVDERFLLEQGVEPWLEPPLWLPGPDARFLEMGVAKAVAAGLRFRPLEETARDTLAWAREAGEQLVTNRPLRQGGPASTRPARRSCCRPGAAAVLRSRHERHSPPAPSRGGNHVSPTCPLLTTQRGGTSRFPHTPSTRSSARGRPMSTVADLMTTDVLTVAPEDTIGETAQKMVEQGVSSAVVSDYGRMIGIVTERDLTRAVAGRVHTSEARVREWMTPDPVTLTKDASAAEAARIMLENRFRHIPIVEDEHTVGIVSIRDVARWGAEED